MKSRTLIAVLSCFVLSGAVLFTSCFREPVPYVFEDIMQPGVENAPLVEISLDTALPPAPGKLPVFKTEILDESYIFDLAHRLGFDDNSGQPDGPDKPYTFIRSDDYQSGVNPRDGIQYLEVYKNGSLQLFTAGMDFKSAPVNLPSFEEAKKIAAHWLVSHDLYPAQVSEVIKGGGLVVTNATTGESTPYSVIVRFQTSLGDYALYTPAASVEVGENGQIIGVHINMIQLKEYETVSIKLPETAFLLKARLSSPLADPPEARESIINIRSFERLSITRVTLQYTSGGGFLQPVYVFEGNAFTGMESAPETFKGKVDAVIRQTPFFNS